MTLSTLSDIPAEMDAMAPDLAAREAVLTPTPLDVLSLAYTRRIDPELAMRIATADGKRFTEEHSK